MRALLPMSMVNRSLESHFMFDPTKVHVMSQDYSRFFSLLTCGCRIVCTAVGDYLPVTFPVTLLPPFCLSLATSLVSLGSKHLSFCTSVLSPFFADAVGTAGKRRYSASSMHRGISGWGAHVKTAAGYGAAATAGGALGPTAAGSGLGFFGFSSSGIVAGSTGAQMMATAGGMLKTGSLCSILQSAAAGGVYASYVLVPTTFGMAVVGGFAYSKRREMYQGMTSIYKKIRVWSRRYMLVIICYAGDSMTLWSVTQTLPDVAHKLWPRHRPIKPWNSDSDPHEMILISNSDSTDYECVW